MSWTSSWYLCLDTGYLRRSLLIRPPLVVRCFRHQLLSSRPYLILTNELTPSFGNERSCRRNNRQ